MLKNTKLFTPSGITGLMFYKDGDPITIFTHTGATANATVRVVDEQKMQRIVFLKVSANGQDTEEVEICCAKGQKWILCDNSIVDELHPGDVLCNIIKIKMYSRFDVENSKVNTSDNVLNTGVQLVVKEITDMVNTYIDYSLDVHHDDHSFIIFDSIPVHDRN